MRVSGYDNPVDISTYSLHLDDETISKIIKRGEEEITIQESLKLLNEIIKEQLEVK